MTTAQQGTAPHGDIDTELGERYYKDRQELEDRLTDDIIDLIRRFISARFEEGRRPALRDAHAGDNGCVKGVFRVDRDLAADLQHGVFVPGAEYPAWIRFSNGGSELRGPRWPDARGMAIKLMGVKGQKLLDDERETQDFILISQPKFFVDDLERYKVILDKFLNGRTFTKQLLSAFSLKGREIWLAIKTNSTFITNPLHHQYWSMTPYRLGVEPGRKTAVKYTAKPQLPARRSFLRALAAYFSPGFSQKKEMNGALAAGEMRFDFYIQRFVDAVRTPIEDSKVEWKEDASPLRHVGTIVIPPQDVMSGDRAAFCEHLSISPWHSLPEHKPLGAVNRVRRKVYLEISRHRHQLNQVPKQEPTGNEAL
jgi:catalase